MPPLLQDSTDAPNRPTHSDSQIPCDLIDLGPLVHSQNNCIEPSLLYLFLVCRCSLNESVHVECKEVYWAMTHSLLL